MTFSNTEIIIAAIVAQILLAIVAGMRMKVISRRFNLIHHLKQHPSGVSENTLRREMAFPSMLRDDLDWLERKHMVLRKVFAVTGARKPLELFIWIN